MDEEEAQEIEAQKQEEQKEPSIKEMLDTLVKQNETLVAEKKVKGWKLPRNSRVGNAKVKKGWATIQVIKHNGEVQFIRQQVNNGMVDVEGFPRLSTIDYRLTHKGKPFYIIPEWSMKPFSPVENYNDTEKEKMNMAGRRLVLERLQREGITAKKGFGSIGWWILGLGVAAVVFYVVKGGKLF